MWGVGFGEECWSDLVDADIGALCGEEHGDEECEGVGMIERDGGFRIELVEAGEEVPCAFSFCHGEEFWRGWWGMQEWCSRCLRWCAVGLQSGACADSGFF